MSQTSYEEQGRCLAGQKYSLLKAENVLSYAAEVAIPFGRAIALGTDKEKQVKLPTAATDITGLALKRGVALQSHDREVIKDGLDPHYAAKQSVSAMTKGGVYVEVEEDVTPEDDVFVRFDDGTLGGNEKGIFRTDADTASAAQLANARFLTASFEQDGKKYAVLELL